MMHGIHKKVNLLLYDYLSGEMSPEQNEEITRHLEECVRCRSDLDAIRTALEMLHTTLPRPSEQRPPEYWNAFAAAVERRLREAGRKRSVWTEVWDELTTFVIRRPAIVSSLAGAAALLLAAVVLWRYSAPNGPLTAEKPSEMAGIQQVAADSMNVDQRMSDYLRKSKILLVGISNMKLEDDRSVDLSSERNYSRGLLQEARYLEGQPIDNRSARLVSNLKKILIQLANAKEEGDAPNVELIRSGIHQENLLFKIRIAESLYDTSQFAQNYR